MSRDSREEKHVRKQMQSYIRPLSEGFVFLRALMKFALPLLSRTSASRAVSQHRVWGSRSDLLCHQLEHISHRTVGFLNLLVSTSSLSLSSLFPVKRLDSQFPWSPISLLSILPRALAGGFNPRSRHRLHPGSTRPTQSAHSYWLLLPRSDSSPGAQATLVSTGCDDPF